MAKIFKNRFVLFFILLVVFVVSYYIYTSNLPGSIPAYLPSTETKDLWFYSGLFMVLFSILFIEPYYSSPKNVITNTIPLLLVLLSVKTSFNNQMFWASSFTAFSLLLILSILAMTLNDKSKSPDEKINKIARSLKNFVMIFGKGKILYSLVFVYFLLSYYSINDFYTFILFLFWGGILMIDPKEIHNSFVSHSNKGQIDQVGTVFSIQSKKIFLVKLFEDKKDLNKFDIVEFKYATQVDVGSITGIVFDTYLLNQEKWAKVLQLGKTRKENCYREKNIVYKIRDKKKIIKISKTIRLEDLVGVIIEGSTIGKVRFEYSKKTDDIQEGDLLELQVGKKRLFYQVVGGITEKEILEAKNETGFVEGEAIQLGEWQNEELSFQKFGWVPAINTPTFKADVSNIRVEEYQYPYYKLGYIPGTTLPSVINLQEAVSHHTAILGITGSGKSYLAREIINQIKIDTKVICVDFNKEFSSTLSPAPQNIIGDSEANEIASRIDWINLELEKFPNQQNKTLITAKQDELTTIIKSEIENFLDDEQINIKVFELPDVSNTTGILDYTKYFFKVLFEVAKERQIQGNSAKICVVLEEAHTIIPEWNFSGSSDKTSQALVNSIGQITLQGRKYGVGFLVIAQRTANVSKTVLTQCNTVICFQAYDETSFSFLGNYVGKDMVQTLPNLKRYHAIVAGRAVKSNMPMIIDMKRG